MSLVIKVNVNVTYIEIIFQKKKNYYCKVKISKRAIKNKKIDLE